MRQQQSRFRQTNPDLNRLLESLRQNSLISKRQMFEFLRDRGLAGYDALDRFEAVLKELPVDLLHPDGAGEFHPFRFYTAFKALEESTIAKVSLSPADVEIVDLAVLLEPIYWPQITYRRTSSGGEAQYLRLWDEYKGRLLPLLGKEDNEKWRSYHQRLLQIAARLDSNQELYLLLRL